jgi:hypothetical protein
MLALESTLGALSLFEHLRPDEVGRLAARFTRFGASWQVARTPVPDLLAPSRKVTRPRGKLTGL